MRHPYTSLFANRPPSRMPHSRVAVLVGLLSAVALLAAPSAFATYEQVGLFGGQAEPYPETVPPAAPGFAFPEEVQLGGASGLAPNIAGVGGVAPGVLYEIGSNESEMGIARFSSAGVFEEGWNLHSGARCGPASGGSPFTPCEVRPAASAGSAGVAVDQTTGYVYALTEAAPGHDLISVWSPDGSTLISRFGEQASPSESTAASPEKIHGSPYAGAIAVDGSGDVYVFDFNQTAGFTSRVMVFKPQSAGDYEHYAYAGQSDDIGTGSWSESPVLDAAGNVYGFTDTAIFEFKPSQLTTPACEFSLSAGGISAMTVNPQSGEVFYYNYKNQKIHELTPCDSQHEFVETATFRALPKRANISALTLNPALRYSPGRPPGVLYAASEGPGPGTAALGYIFAPAEERAPSVALESISAVTATTASLGAAINPNGSPTRYAFQYLSAAAFEANPPEDRFAGAVEVPSGGAALGSGQSPLVAAASVSVLAPDTEYRYRVIATSQCKPGGEACEAVGAPSAFHTYPLIPEGLTDHRAYELVSPVDKDGGQVFPADPFRSSCLAACKPGENGGSRYPMQSSPDGEAIVYEGEPLSHVEGAKKDNQYLSRRTATGWRTSTLSPGELAEENGSGFKAFDAGLDEGVLNQFSPSLAPNAPGETPNLYLQESAAPSSLTPLLTDPPPNRLSDELELVYAGASEDFTRQYFEANDALTSGTATAPAAVDGGVKKNNLYESGGSGLRLVNVLPGNGATEPGAVFGSGLQLANSEDPSDYSHAISDDGEKVFWSSEAGQVYVREHGETTREIPDHIGRFLTASANGERLLLSDGELFGVGDLAEAPVDLAQGKGKFEGVVGQSEDLTVIYFVDREVLDSGANSQGEIAHAGDGNLYMWNGTETVFVATVEGTEVELAYKRPSPVVRPSEASPDGSWVAFLSERPLTGYDNQGPSCFHNGPVFSAAPCSEVFLYDSATRALRCPSCNAAGSVPLGSSTLSTVPQAEGSSSQPRYLTNEGRLVFESQDSLVPRDVNGRSEDVYEYEPDTLGTCARAEGCVSLISGGDADTDSNFLAMDASGKNIFFTTREALSPQDKDEQIDLYDAREGGGITAESEVTSKECSGDECQAPPPPPPSEVLSGSLAFSGPGNLLFVSAPGNLAKPKSLTRAQQLAKALRACKKQPRRRRSACERTARKKYGAKVKAKRARNHRKEAK